MTVEMFERLREQVTELTQLVTQVIGNQNHKSKRDNESYQNQRVRNDDNRPSDVESGSSSDKSSAQGGGFANNHMKIVLYVPCKILKNTTFLQISKLTVIWRLKNF